MERGNNDALSDSLEQWSRDMDSIMSPQATKVKFVFLIFLTAFDRET